MMDIKVPKIDNVNVFIIILQIMYEKYNLKDYDEYINI